MKLNGTITVDLGSNEHDALLDADGVQATFSIQQEEVTKNAKKGVAVFRIIDASTVLSGKAPAPEPEPAPKPKKAPKTKAAPKKKAKKTK